MGGKLLKKWNLPEKRLSNDEYENLKRDILSSLHEDARIWSDSMVSCFVYEVRRKGPQIDVARAIRSKQDHGDLDVVVGVDFLNYGNFIKYIQDTYGVKPHQNSNVISFPVNGFQVDVTFVNNDFFNQTIAYTSWGDLGNLMGRIYHKMGLHYGHEGLQYWIREGMFRENNDWSDSDHICSKFVISTSMWNICEAGGFDFNRWFEGFNTEEDAFQFIATSKYFRKDIYSFENLNHINRVRNKKRGMYMRFLEWVDKTNPPDSPVPLASKEDYSLYYQYRYIELQKAIDRCRFEFTIKSRVKEKFSGKVVLDVLGDIDGELVGEICKKFKSVYSPIEIIMMTPEHIKQTIRALHNQ